MSIDATFILSYLIFCLIEVLVLIFIFKIYRSTSGASLAYKKWAQGIFLLFLGCFLFVFCGLLFECSDSISTNKNEIMLIVGNILIAFGYFYIPLGVLYLSKDFGVGNVNETLIKKTQIVFFTSMSILAMVFGIFTPFYKIINVIGFIFCLVFASIWIFTLYFYKKIYNSVLKKINICWTFIYLGMAFGLVSEIFNAIYFVIPFFVYPMLISQLIMASNLILGYFKLAKMVEAL